MKNGIKNIKNRIKDEQGMMQIVEASIVFPVMFFVLFFIIFIGNMYFEQAKIDNIVLKYAVMGAEYVKDPYSYDISKGNSLPTSASNVKPEPYRYIIGTGLNGNISKTVDNISTDVKKEINDKSLVFFSNSKANNVTTDNKNGKVACFNNYIMYSTFSVQVNYQIKFPIRFLGDDYPTVVNMSSRAEVAVDDVPEFIRNVDMVVGDRLSSTYFQENKRPFHNFGNSLVRASINFLFHTEIKDIMTGYRAFSFQFAKSFPVLSRGFEIETEMSIHAVDKNMQVENVVIEYRDRPEGSESKLNTYSDGYKVIKTIMRLFKNYKPLAFFSGIAAVLALLSMVFVIPVFSTYLRTGQVPNFPTLIVCGFTMMAALCALFAGLQLQNIVQKNRQDFEMHLILLDSIRKGWLNSNEN